MADEHDSGIEVPFTEIEAPEPDLPPDRTFAPAEEPADLLERAPEPIEKADPEDDQPFFDPADASALRRGVGETIVFTGGMRAGITSMALTFAKVSALRGLRTIVVDADPRGGIICTLLGADIEREGVHVLAESTKDVRPIPQEWVAKAVNPVGPRDLRDNLALISGFEDVVAAYQMPRGAEEEVLKALAAAADVVVVDAGPVGPGWTLNLMAAAAHVVAVCQPNEFGALRLQQAWQFGRFQAFSRVTLRHVSALINCYDRPDALGNLGRLLEREMDLPTLGRVPTASKSFDKALAGRTFVDDPSVLAVLDASLQILLPWSRPRAQPEPKRGLFGR